MMIDSETQKKRAMLGGLTKLMFSVLLLAMVWIGFSFVGTDLSSNKAIKSKAVDLTKFQEGVAKTIEWEGRPILVLRRSHGMLDELRTSDGMSLRDAYSVDSKQPKWAESEFRSREPAWFVAIASGTDFGCPVEYLPSTDERFAKQRWPGGFRDTCRGSRYDLSGRVYKSQNAQLNLEIPSYRIEKGILHLGGL